MNAEHKGTVAFALCGSFCTFEAAVPQAARLAAMGWQVLPIMSFAASATDTRFERPSLSAINITAGSAMYEIITAQKTGSST